MRIIQNPYRGTALPAEIANIRSSVRVNSSSVINLLSHCPHYKQSPLLESSVIARRIGIKNLLIKDERSRFGLGGVKALGAGYVVARDAYNVAGKNLAKDTLKGEVYVTAGEGNHGISLAASSYIFGAEAIVYLSKAVPKSSHQRLIELGAKIVVAGDDYAESLESAHEAAKKHGWKLFSDSTWSGYEGGIDVMEGYLAVADEIVGQVKTPPTHVFIQAGVGALAAALSVYLRKVWGDDVIISIVESRESPTLMDSVLAAKPIVTFNSITSHGRLDSKEPSYAALKALAYHADYFITVSDEHVENAIIELENNQFATTPAGGAGYAGMLYALQYGQCKITKDSTGLIILTEGVA